MSLGMVLALVPFHDDGPNVEFSEPWIFQQFVLTAFDVDLQDVDPPVGKQSEDIDNLYLIATPGHGPNLR